jgi:NDP-sugar pyrophosphorylase family protein
MQALILAGGKGTRLRPLTLYTPKPIVPIGNRPFLLFQIEMLRRTGITDITLSLNYQPDKIEHILDDGSQFGVKIRYLTEPSPMGTAGGFRFAADYIKETAVVLNGDVLTDLDLGAVLREHKERNATASIYLTPVSNPSAYGLVETDFDGRIKRFLEKPKPEEINELGINTINAGVYVLEPKVLDYIPKGESYSFEYGLFPDLLRRGEPFFAHIPKDTYWLDIGTPSRYLQAHQDLLANKIKHFAPESRRGKYDAANDVQIDNKSLIADDCVFKPGVKIINSVLGQGVFVEEKAVIENSVIWSHARVNASATVSNAILGRGCHVGNHCIVGPGSVLGDKTALSDYTQT